MTTQLTELIDAVNVRFEARRPATWADPHDGMRAPAEEEYSRLSNPDKYLVVQHRCQDWEMSLVEAGIATSRSNRRTLEHFGEVVTIELAPLAADAAELYVHLTTDNLPGVVLALGDPLATITFVPRCGCDACDGGSDELLEEIDNVFTSVVLGVASVERTPTSSRVVLLNHTSGSSGGENLTTGRWTGASWLDIA